MTHTPRNDARRNQVEHELALLRDRVGRLAVRVEGAEGAIVEVDGVEAGRIPLPHAFAVEPGLHEVVVRPGNASPLRQSLQVAAGAEVPVVFALAAAPPPVATPVVETPTPEPPTATVMPPERHRHLGAWIAAWACVGLAVAGLGSTLGLYLWNRSEFETWSAMNTTLNDAMEPGAGPLDIDVASAIGENNQRADRINAVSAATWAMLAIGAAAAVAAVTLFALAPRLTRPRQVALLPAPRGLLLSAAW
jgi:hypothetical protein